MAKLVSSWYKQVKSLPESYILPPDERPGIHPIPVSDQIPVVDLERPDSTQLILKACQEFGFFQVINHGVKESLMDEGMKVFSEFFDMAEEEKAEFYSEEPQSIPCVVSTSSGSNVDSEKPAPLALSTRIDVSEEYLRSTIDYVEIDRPRRLEFGGKLTITQWTRFPIYEMADFGWGRPVYAGPIDLTPTPQGSGAQWEDSDLYL
ncbi:Protein DOWNY MILDEW RESISTANCE 6 [Linum perenne]